MYECEFSEATTRDTELFGHVGLISVFLDTATVEYYLLGQLNGSYCSSTHMPWGNCKEIFIKTLIRLTGGLRLLENISLVVRVGAMVLEYFSPS